MVYSLKNSFKKWPFVIVTLLLFVSLGVAIFTLVTASDSIQGEENLKTVNSALILCQEQTNILYTNLTAVENQVLTLKSELASVRAETQGEINSLQKNLTRISQELQSTSQQYTQAMESKQAADSLNQEHLSKIKALEEELSALSGVNRPVPVHTITALYIAALLMALPVNVL
ncbi:hypothetical protein HHUSO_G35129 [Huso huso]|uniref:Uncharacterized protein n=1 Tax=Huso huso TaxID=61971 RepID=A0ABR0Y5A2_HUSHU